MPQVEQAAAARRGKPVGNMNGALGGRLSVDLGRR